MKLSNSVPAQFVHDLANELHSAFKERKITSIQHVKPGKLANIISEVFGYNNYNTLSAEHKHSEATPATTEAQQVTIVSIVTQNPDNDSVQSIESELFYSVEDADNYLEDFALDLFDYNSITCEIILEKMQEYIDNNDIKDILTEYSVDSLNALIDIPEDLIVCARKYMPTAAFFETVCPSCFSFSTNTTSIPVKVVTKEVIPSYIPEKANNEHKSIEEVTQYSQDHDDSNAVCRGNLIAAIKNDAKKILEKSYEIMIKYSKEDKLEQYVNHESLMEIIEQLMTIHGRQREIEPLNRASLHYFTQEEITRAYRSVIGIEHYTLEEATKKVESFARHNLYQSTIMDIINDFDNKTPEEFNPTKTYYSEEWTIEDQEGYKKLMDAFIKENLS